MRDKSGKFQYTTVAIDKIKEHIIDGKTVQQIADIFGVSKPSMRGAILRHTDGVNFIRRRHNVTVHKRHGVPWKRGSNLDDLIDLILQGKTIEEIAEHFGVSVMAARNAIYRYTDGMRRIKSRGY